MAVLRGLAASSQLGVHWKEIYFFSKCSPLVEVGQRLLVCWPFFACSLFLAHIHRLTRAHGRIIARQPSYTLARSAAASLCTEYRIQIKVGFVFARPT